MDGKALPSCSDAFSIALSRLLEAHCKEVSQLQDQIGRLRGNGASDKAEPSQIWFNGIEEHHQVEPAHLTCVTPPREISNSDSVKDSKESASNSRQQSAGSEAVMQTYLAEDKRRRSKAAKKRTCTIAELEREKQTSVWLFPRIMAAMVNTARFELFFGFVIFTNALFMGIQVEYDAGRTPGEEVPTVFSFVRYSYSFAFSIELCMRLCANGVLRFLWSSNYFWNYLDIFVVVTAWAEILVDVTGTSSTTGGINTSNLRVVRFLRVARLTRVLRIGKMFRLIRDFKVLIHSLLSTVNIIAWALVLLFTIIYVFALVLVQAVVEHRNNVESLSPAMLEYWGTLPRAMLTLFKTVTNGLDWDECVVPLSAIHPIWVILFVFYVTVTMFAVLNVITGVFCESAMEAASSDRDLALQKHMTKRKEYVAKVQALFKDMDNDNSNMLTLDEFEKHFDEEECVAFFAALDIEADMAWDLFKLLDVDEGGCLDINEFITGCLRLRGTAKSLEVAKLIQMSMRNDNVLARLQRDIQIVMGQTRGLLMTGGRLSPSEAEVAPAFSLRSLPPATGEQAPELRPSSPVKVSLSTSSPKSLRM